MSLDPTAFPRSNSPASSDSSLTRSRLQGKEGKLLLLKPLHFYAVCMGMADLSYEVRIPQERQELPSLCIERRAGVVAVRQRFTRMGRLHLLP